MLRRRVRILLLAIVASAVLGAIACGRPEPAAGRDDRAELQPPGVAGLDILLITIDTLRADALGSYGKADAGTPWMDRLAAAGVRFDSAHAHNVTTLPSHASILSGLLPVRHGVRDNLGFRFPEEIPTLATILASRGYRTGAFISAYPLDSRFGLARGFDVYDDSFVDAGIKPAFVEQERAGVETVARARAWLDAGRESPTFTWVHLYEPHYPYAPPEPLAQRFASDLYQGDVAAADAALEPLLAPLLGAAEAADTLVVLTSDHGESLGEHGEATHGIFAYEGVLRVPLILHLPRVLAPRTVSSEVRLIDLAPTVLELAAVPVPAGLDGDSLVPLAAGVDRERRTETYFEALSGRLNRGWAPLYGVIVDGWKLIELPLPELYDLASDPGETTNLVERERARAQELKGALTAFRAADVGADPSPESAEVRDRLRALGYLGGAPADADKVFTEADDPKRLIGLDAILREIAGLHEAGDLTAAAARARELVGRRPDMRIALMYLAQIERDLGNLDAAADAMGRAHALNPADTSTLALLASYLIQAGRPGEALEITASLASGERPDVEVLLVRSLAQARSGGIEDGLATLASARAIEPDNPLVPVHVGTLLLMSGRHEPARAAFEEALALNPQTVQALTALGVMGVEQGRMEEALGYWRRSVELDPREHAKLLAIGGRLWGAGDRKTARALLELFESSAPYATYGPQIDRVRRLLAGAG